MLIEAYWERVHREDKQLAHYTALQMATHLGKKAPKAERIRFYQDAKKQEGAKVTDIQQAKERKQIREILKARNQQAG